MCGSSSENECDAFGKSHNQYLFRNNVDSKGVKREQEA